LDAQFPFWLPGEAFIVRIANEKMYADVQNQEARTPRALMGLAALASPLRIRRQASLCIDCAKCAGLARPCCRWTDW